MFGRRTRNATFGTPSLEIHIPISPTPVFGNMVHYFVHSLRAYGGRYRDTKVVLTVGAMKIDRSWERTNGWIAKNQIEVRWLPEKLFQQRNYFATAVERFRYRFLSDVVLMLDADVLIHRPFEELIDRCFDNQEFAGLITHVSPLKGDITWQSLYDAADIGTAHPRHEHTGWGYMFDDSSKRYCPPYFNLGVLCGPAKVMNAVGEKVYRLMDAVDHAYASDYKCQIAVGMAVDSLKIPYWTMPMRFNFPNDPLLEALHGTELPYASILHLLRDHQGIYKTKVFASSKDVTEMLLREDLRGVNELARQTLRTILPSVQADR